ncbi:Inosine-5'-monophosphate dehydrogenase [Leclercia adecarboxylata]|uniref:Inosine-5'-monophosphate dehydrogenase n=1 Tax=Leclercia adecarboxylata TaxID=83655 RepID=A0A4U9I9D4_9ENTR|nr:Inosine-5'-monophosphate dehydrogenase [Leclercia adecarboxylata]
MAVCASVLRLAPGAGNEERVDALVAAGVDVLLIDSSHGHSEGVLQRIRETRAKYP